MKSPGRARPRRTTGGLVAPGAPHLHSSATPHVAASCRTPPGPEGSKGRRALPGTWGAFPCPGPPGRRPCRPADGTPGRPGVPTLRAGCNGHERSATTPNLAAPCACRRGWLGFRGGVTPRPLPALPAGDLPGGHRAGPRDRATTRGPRRQPGQPRLPLLRAARLRQDHQRADPGPVAQLRPGAGGRPVRRVRLLSGARPRRTGQHRRHRDRRRLPQRRGRRP